MKIPTDVTTGYNGIITEIIKVRRSPEVHYTFTYKVLPRVLIFGVSVDLRI